ncbi:MAG: NAD(P)-dependent oxidoreductase [Planctomycetota bacterium]|nr:MAG: NAD(P)-dependent oxidoreductase [Planctomycetota bacterium]
MASLPKQIESEDQLDEFLSTPTPELVDAVRGWEGRVLVLGAGGKMGPSLCWLARRALDQAGAQASVTAVSRFRNPAARRWLEDRGIETIAADLFDGDQLSRLPDARRVVYLVGMKFGTSSNPELTWAVNTLVPAMVADRYRTASIVALSTGNVYPLSPVDSTGSREDDPLTPIGEYANAAVARERIFEYCSRRNETAICLVRLNYAHDLRYGVITDIGLKLAGDAPIDVTMGYFNAIWQGDANALILRCFELCSHPPTAINLAGPQRLRVRDVAEQLARRLGREPQFVGRESSTALLSDPTRLVQRFGPPCVDADTLIDWVGHWMANGGPTLGKPTHFEVRDGRY